MSMWLRHLSLKQSDLGVQGRNSSVGKELAFQT